MPTRYTFTSSKITGLFKDCYGVASEATFNATFPTSSRIKKNSTFTGKQKSFPVPLTYGGSVGSGSMPAANMQTVGTVTLTRKKHYGRLRIDRETIKAAMGGDKGAFIDGTKAFVENVVRSYTRNAARMLFGDGTLGTVAASSGVSGSAPDWVVIISTTTFKLANWEEDDYVNFGTSLDPFVVTAVNESTRAISVTRVSGSTTPANGDVIYMQNSKDAEATGLKTVCDATSGSLYGITVQRRWQSYQSNAAAASVTIAMINAMVLGIIKKTGVSPTELVTSYDQYAKILDLLEDAKTYQLSPRDKRFEALASFGGVQFLTPAGIIPLVPDQMCDDKRIYALNTDFIERFEAPDHGWFDDDGTVLLREADDDGYEARYGGYWEYYINPAYQGVITNLAQ